MIWGWVSGGFWRQPPRPKLATNSAGRAAILILSMGPSIEQRPCRVKLACGRHRRFAFDVSSLGLCRSLRALVRRTYIGGAVG